TYVNIQYFNSSGTYITESSQPASAINDSEAAGGSNLTSYKRIYVLMTAPATASYALVRLMKNDTDTGESDSYLFAQYIQFEKATISQIEASSWVGSIIEIEDEATAGATWGTDITNEPTDLADVNATEGANLTGIEAAATVGADWDVDLDNIPPIAYGSLCPDPTNLCADSNFARTLSSSDDTFWLMNDADWAATYGYNSSEGIRLEVESGGLVTAIYIRNNDSIFYLPAINGNTYHFQIRVKKDAAYDATYFRMSVKMYDKDLSLLATITSSDITFAAANTWYVKTGSITLNQANCHSVQLGFMISNGTAGYVYFDDIWIGRVAL
ncbi:MAG: hypothetical protein KAV87_51350, partial [Desulfobacteraceae bacterium]|nr:hypothetical protein [Desulfobacteraceae bacterium]